MGSGVRFETPENIEVSYRPAGLGTRFIGWFLDNIILWFVGIVLFFVFVCAGIITEGVFNEVFAPLDDLENTPPSEMPQVQLYFIGLWWLIWGLGGFFYFGCCELLLRGQTPGKRAMRIRVVKTDGFSLDAVSILIRNVFRVVDHLPPFWVVPVVSARSQRLGDMTAGTIVVSDEQEELGTIRSTLAGRSPVESRFRFDHATLKRARAEDFEAVERILERWDELPDEQRETLLENLLPGLVRRLQLDPPEDEDRLQFLEDLLAAEFRRRSRKLG